MGEWSRMQHHFSDILSSDTKAGDLERRMWVFNVRKVGHVCWRHMFVALSELIVSIRSGLSAV